MQKSHRRQTFIWIAAIFIVPMLVSAYLYHYHDRFQFKTVNYGALVNPPVSASMLIKNKERKWHVVLVDNGVCDAACDKLSYQLHQVQKALGANRDRVVIVAVNGHDASLRQLKNLFAQHGLLLEVTNKVYLVDPDNNLFMYYSATTDPVNILKDLKKVLEVSQIG